MEATRTAQKQTNTKKRARNNEQRTNIAHQGREELREGGGTGGLAQESS